MGSVLGVISFVPQGQTVALQTLTSTLAGRRRFLPSKEQGEFLLQFYRDVYLGVILSFEVQSGNRQCLHRRFQPLLWRFEADALQVA